MTTEETKPAAAAAADAGETTIDTSDLAAALPKETADAPEQAGDARSEKLIAISEEVAAFLDTFPPQVKARINTLQELQKSHDELEAQFLEEKAKLEAKYQKLYEPLYVKRHDIVTGASDASAAAAEAAGAEGDQKGVPEFWLTALKNNSLLAEQITARDEGALKYLTDIKWQQLEGGKGFKLDFFFDSASNPYFKNQVLSKTYHMIDEEEPILENAQGTEIEWNSGKNLTVKILKKKPAKGARSAKPITKTEPCESFFNFFTPPAVPEDEDELDEEEAEELQDLLEQDYETGLIIKTKIIPHAVSWFTGEAIDEDDLEDDEDEDDEEDLEDEEEDDDEDDDEDDGKEEKALKGKKKGGKSGKGGSGGKPVSQVGPGEQPQECKQQ